MMSIEHLDYLMKNYKKDYNYSLKSILSTKNKSFYQSPDLIDQLYCYNSSRAN